MLTDLHFDSLGQGKSRGILTFYASLDGQLYQIKAKGKVITWIYPVTLVGGLVQVSIAIGQPGPVCPAVSPDLVAHARRVAKAEGR